MRIRSTRTEAFCVFLKRFGAMFLPRKHGSGGQLSVAPLSSHKDSLYARTKALAFSGRRAGLICLPLAARARAHVREERPRFKLEKRRGLELAEAFFAASRSGDMKALGAMLAADVSLHSDGGGKRRPP